MSDIHVDLSPVLYRLSSLENRVEQVQAFLPPMAQALGVVHQKVGEVESEVGLIRREQGELRQQVGLLHQEFQAYVEVYTRRTELQLAETRLVKVRQELEQRFGHYAEVRRRVTGILQAADIAIVRQETVRTATEELMLAAPRYWLAPTLVALAAWLSDHRDLAERALGEAIRRDDDKVSLFFALVTRRSGRSEPLARWLERYLLLQDPRALDRETVVLIDAVANGVFGGTSRQVFWQTSVDWLRRLGQEPGEVEQQRRRWSSALEVWTPGGSPGEYQMLRRHSPTWPALEAALAGARRNGALRTFFLEALATRIDVSPQLQTVVDDLLDSLCVNFDEEELPLRRQERLWQLVIDEEGDRPEAERRMQAEQESLQEKVSFAALLANAAMFPEQAKATRATQRFSLALSREWILDAHRNLVARDRQAVPADIELRIEQWTGRTQDGSNAPDLAQSVTALFEAKIAQEVQAIGLGSAAWIGGIGGVLFLILWVTGVIAWTLALSAVAVGLGCFAWAWRERGRLREECRVRLLAAQEGVLQTLNACLAEVVAYRRDWTQADAEAADLESFLKSMDPRQLVFERPGELPEATGRSLDLQVRQDAPLASQLPGWNLLPPPLAVPAC